MTSPQARIGSPFNAHSTAEEVIAAVDLSGQTAIVTGGYSGLGLEAARVLALAGARVIVPSRAPDRAAAALRSIGGVEVATLDLMSAASIDAFAERFINSGRPLNILLNSAGVMASPLARDSRGHESQLSTNHLGHFQLTAKLWPALKLAPGARVVSVSSRAHHIAPVDFEDVNFERRPYDKWQAYGQSKTANALFAVALDARGKSENIRAYAVHPGTILGPLARHLSPDEIAKFGVYDGNGNVIVDPERDLKNVQQGAATSVWCATSALLADIGGVYCEDCDVALITPAESNIRAGVKSWATDRDNAQRLWELSEFMTGTRSR